jgi:hypothetical protein
MRKYYLIVCKNDFPPVDKFTICSYETFLDIPIKYRTIFECYSSAKTFRDGILETKKEELVYLICTKDPVDAMIKFWSEYIYGERG